MDYKMGRLLKTGTVYSYATTNRLRIERANNIPRLHTPVQRLTKGAPPGGRMCRRARDYLLQDIKLKYNEPLITCTFFQERHSCG